MSSNTPNNNAEPNIAQTEQEAVRRFNRWKGKDPFPAIQPALLNSADILAYVKTTSLIHPFEPNRLKGASYDVTIEGDVVYYNADAEVPEKREVIHHLIKDGDYFDLQPNSIAFVTLKPTFRIPYYLALRFNLKITHIYKGLLLGTGPLVDPGFNGRLSIPLHNLTNNTYRFFKGDELITMEFTKMSPNEQWDKNTGRLGHSEAYIANDIDANRNVLDYIRKALKKDRLTDVISSIPGAMRAIRDDAEQARKSAQKAEQSATKAIKDGEKSLTKIEKKASVQAIIQAAVSIVAVCSLIFSAIGFSFDAMNKANERYDAIQSEYVAIKEEYSDIIDDLQNQIEDLQRVIEQLTLDTTVPDGTDNSTVPPTP